MLEILALIREIVNQIMGLFVQFHRTEETDFDSVETQVRSVMLEIGRQTVETIIGVRGTGYAGKRITTPSGSKAKYREMRSRTIKTLMGPVEIRRAYYHLGKGKGGYVPLDESLSVPPEQYSYAVQVQMSLYAIEDSYEESAKKLRYTFPVEASGSTVGRISGKHGEEIFHAETDRVEAIFSHRQPPPEPEIESVKRGYVGTDGVMVPTVNGYKEMKVVTTYDTSYAKETLADNLYYHALFAEPEVLGEHLWVMLKQRGIHDGADSTWVADIHYDRYRSNCAGCGNVEYPLDKALGLQQPRQQFSSSVEELAVLCGASWKYQEAEYMMQKVLQLRCACHETVFNKTTQVGKAASQELEGVRIKELEDDKKLQGEYFDNMEVCAEPAERIYMDMDGVMINSILVVGDPTMEGKVAIVWSERELVKENTYSLTDKRAMGAFTDTERFYWDITAELYKRSGGRMDEVDSLVPRVREGGDGAELAQMPC